MDKNKRILKQKENIINLLRDVTHNQSNQKENKSPYFSKVGGKYIPHKK